MVFSYFSVAYKFLVGCCRLTFLLGLLAWLQKLSVFNSVLLFAKYAFSKILLWVFGLLQMLFTATHFGSTLQTTKLRRPYTKQKRMIKTVYFIRHGQSIWNSMFNNGVKGFLTIPVILLQELWLVFTPHTLIFDSPLSKEGRKQSLNLGLDLEEVVQVTSPSARTPDRIRLLTEFRHRSGEPEKFVIVASPLRRAISTLLYGINTVKMNQPIIILKCLQEMTRNFDGVPLAGSKNSIPVLHRDEKDLEDEYKKLDLQHYVGRHGFWGTNQQCTDRIFDFAEWVFDSSNQELETIIVGGHSLWFRRFFQAFASDESHPSRRKKMPNAKIVKFTFVACPENGYSAENICPVNFDDW